jgi:hypothetical protein
VQNRLLAKIENDGEDICGRTCTASRVGFISSFFFRFVTLFWPKKVKASKLEEIHAKMVMKEAAPRASSDISSLKKPRVGVGAKTNGTLPTATASSRTNGKSYR